MSLSPTEENALARAVQAGVPLRPRPFDELASALGLEARAVLAQLRAWAAAGKLREISAVLEGSLLGYESALCTAAVPEQELARVAAAVNEHPTVSHNYVRDHAYNLWFTIAAPAAMGLLPTLERLAAACGVPRFHPLRRTRTYKVGVNFDLLRRCSLTQPPAPAPAACTRSASAAQVRMFRALQTPLPLVAEPFAEMARCADADPETLLAFARSQLGGTIRRFVGTFHHRALGVRGNGMVVWQVHEDQLDRAGARLAAVPEVSHCYARESFAAFPYSLYSMIHGPDEDSVRALAARLAPAVGADDYLVLFSVQELKKCRLRYF